MPKFVKYTDWSAKERLALIRKQNVERHVGFEAKQKLRANILRHQVLQNEQMELDRLKAATVHGNLHAAAEARMKQLAQKLLGKENDRR